MKFHRPAAVFAAAVILAGGAVVAVNAVTATSPVTLCSNKKTGAVTVPVNGACGRGTTSFSVANDADVQAVAGRVDALETLAASQNLNVQALTEELADLEYLQPVVNFDIYVGSSSSWVAATDGRGLLPGASVLLMSGETHLLVLGQVDADGTLTDTARTRVDGYCNAPDVYVKTRDANNNLIESTHILTRDHCV